MSAAFGFGLGGSLSGDSSSDLITSHLYKLMQLGLAEEIVEIVDGKVLVFQYENGDAKFREQENAIAEKTRMAWGEGNGFLGSMSYDDWEMISPDSVSIFLPMEEDFFEEFEIEPQLKLSMGSIGKAISHLEEVLADLKLENEEEGFDDQIEMGEEILGKLRIAMEHKFIFGISS
jgi:hypothetical protein